MRLKLFALVLMSLLISCNSTETIADNDVDANLKKTIKIKNDSLMEAMKLSDYKALKELGSPEFIKFMHAKLKQGNIIWAFRYGSFNTGEYNVLHEYYSKSGKAPGAVVITNDDENYTFTYTNKQKETYVCMLKYSYKGIDDYLVTVQYGLIDGEWKLNDIDIGAYSTYNRNAQQYYTLAEKAKEEGHIVDAWLYYDAADALMDPCNKMLRYDNEEEIDFAATTTREKIGDKYKFPKKLESIQSLPEIIDIAPVKNAKGLYPMVSYKSVIPINDTETLKKEYELIKQEVRKQYPGINPDNDFIYYRAYNEATGNNYTFEDMHKK